MSYISLYRKYRPLTFAELSGQEHIKQTLLSELVGSKISHAYLFSGPRGTGKTSTARILARAVNCLSPKNGEPCNSCERCKEFLEGTALDLIEIDAASNRGIDEIRELREKISFAPATAKYKVFIIDEVHMLTKEAFNALLKTLEEPPAHAIFVLATTEVHKIPATILSRCQHFSFHSISMAAIVKRLKEIAALEKIEIASDALVLLAQKSRGALRDALSILDQLRILEKPIDCRDILDLLGIVDSEAAFEILNRISQNDAEVLTYLSEVFEKGSDPGALLEELTENLRRLIYIKAKTGQIFSELTEHQQETLRSIAEKFSFHQLCQGLDAALETAQQLKISPIAELPVELFVAKLLDYRQPNLSLPQVPPKLTTDMVVDDDLFKMAQAHWGEVLVRLKMYPALQAVLRSGKLVSAGKDQLLIQFPYAFHLNQAIQPKNKILLEKTFSETLGRRIILNCQVERQNFALSKEKDLTPAEETEQKNQENKEIVTEETITEIFGIGVDKPEV
jgi:DNA polymerase-3 subunit gamma/tau